jgi:AcrR family transcriptional regulator
MRTRKYTKRQRAQSEQETRQRIVEAAMQLHEELGPRNTSISAIAERAGVQRLTVYRHFDDESAIFQACSAHWLSLNPPPDPSAWQSEDEAKERTTQALRAMVDYYRNTASMWHGVYRDRDEVPSMQEPMAQFDDYLKGMRDELLNLWQPNKQTRPLLRALLEHALLFSTWQSLANARLNNTQIVNVLIISISAVAQGE